MTIAILSVLGGTLMAQSGLKKVGKDFIIYQDSKFYSTFPSLVQKKDGEIFCAFRRAPDRRMWGATGYTHTDPNSYLELVRSKDGGKTWSKEPELIFAHPMGGSQDPCMYMLKDGSIICTSYGWAEMPVGKEKEMTETLTHPRFAFLGGFIVRSDNDAKTWKGPFVPPPAPESISKSVDAFGNPQPIFNRGRMMQDRHGKLYWAAAVTNPGHPTSVHLFTSTDKGETWTYACPIAQEENITFNETSLIQTQKGIIIAFMRTDKFDGKLAYARSTDGGKSFQPWQDGGFFGHPFTAINLKDGRIFLIYGYRQPPFGIRAKVLNADCTDIATAPEFVIRDDGGGGDLGYPWAVQLPDGNILTAYYFNIGDGNRHIAGSILGLE
jgi:sialidase-1